MTRKQIKEDFTKRGLMTFDFETRETEYFEIVEATQEKIIPRILSTVKS